MEQEVAASVWHENDLAQSAGNFFVSKHLQ